MSTAIGNLPVDAFVVWWQVLYMKRHADRRQAGGKRFTWLYQPCALQYKQNFCL